MKQELKENQGLPASLLWTLAIIAGISVANLYYNQPLLNRISRDLQTSEFTANLIAMITQIGYAIGLLFIIPLVSGVENWAAMGIKICGITEQMPVSREANKMRWIFRMAVHFLCGSRDDGDMCHHHHACTTRHAV